MIKVAVCEIAQESAASVIANLTPLPCSQFDLPG